MSNPVRKVHAISYHRNGISGRGFWNVLFTAKGVKGQMLAIVPSHPEPGDCFVLNAKMVGEHNIAFGQNSWRGDDYEAAIIAAIEAHERAEREKTFGRPLPDDYKVEI